MTLKLFQFHAIFGNTKVPADLVESLQGYHSLYLKDQGQDVDTLQYPSSDIPVLDQHKHQDQAGPYDLHVFHLYWETGCRGYRHTKSELQPVVANSTYSVTRCPTISGLPQHYFLYFPPLHHFEIQLQVLGNHLQFHVSNPSQTALEWTKQNTNGKE